MVLIDGIKYACERCIRGHRVSTCTHTEGPLVPIKPKGRPTSQCSHCREARKARALHTKCLCGASAGKTHSHAPSCPCAIDPNLCTCLKNKRTRSVSTSSRKSSKGHTPPLHSESHVSLTSLTSLSSLSSSSTPPVFIPDHSMRNNGTVPLIISTNSDNSPYHSLPSSYASPSPVNSMANSFISLNHQPALSSHTPFSPLKKAGGDDNESNTSMSYLPASSNIPQSDSEAYDDDGWLALTATATITAHNYSSHPSSVSISPQLTGNGSGNESGSRAASIRSFEVNGKVESEGISRSQSQSRPLSRSLSQQGRRPEARSQSLSQQRQSRRQSQIQPQANRLQQQQQQQQQPNSTVDPYDFTSNNQEQFNSNNQVYPSYDMFMAISSFDSFAEGESENNPNPTSHSHHVEQESKKSSNTQVWLDILAPERNEKFDWSAISETSMKSEVALPSESGLSSTFDDATPQTTSYLYSSYLPKNYEDLDERERSERIERMERTLGVNLHSQIPTESAHSLPDMWNYYADQ